jgi:aspartate aminotransferase
MISTCLSRVKPSPTLSINAKAVALKEAGHKIISLAAGEPDFSTPLFIQEEAMTAIQRGETRYTPVDGTPALKKAIMGKFKRENDLDYTPAQISVANGAKQIIFNAFMATLNPGDEVIIPAPYWVSYEDMVLLSGGSPVIVPCPSENGFKITPAQLKEALTPRTKWFILNSPNNPTGAVYSQEELQALAHVIHSFPSLMILSDDIYEHIRYTPGSFHTLAQVAPLLKDQILTVNGVSKAYAMTGWRIGYGGGPEWLITAMGTLQSHTTSNPCSISQAASVAALQGPQDFLLERTQLFRQRRDGVVTLLNQIPGLSCQSPEGAFYIYVSCQGVIGKTTPQGTTLLTDTQVAGFLLEEAGVAVVPGEAFGMSPYLRLSYATSLEVLEAACEAMGKSLGSLG